MGGTVLQWLILAYSHIWDHGSNLHRGSPCVELHVFPVLWCFLHVIHFPPTVKKHATWLCQVPHRSDPSNPEAYKLIYSELEWTESSINVPSWFDCMFLLTQQSSKCNGWRQGSEIDEDDSGHALGI